MFSWPAQKRTARRRIRTSAAALAVAAYHGQAVQCASVPVVSSLTPPEHAVSVSARPEGREGGGAAVEVGSCRTHRDQKRRGRCGSGALALALAKSTPVTPTTRHRRVPRAEPARAAVQERALREHEWFLPLRLQSRLRAQPPARGLRAAAPPLTPPLAWTLVITERFPPDTGASSTSRFCLDFRLGPRDPPGPQTPSRAQCPKGAHQAPPGLQADVGSPGRQRPSSQRAFPRN